MLKNLKNIIFDFKKNQNHTDIFQYSLKQSQVAFWAYALFWATKICV